MAPPASERGQAAARTACPAARAGLLLGIGMGGFFDGIVFHQILQWHHMLSSAGYPTDSLVNLKLNTRVDGLFHAATFLAVAWGLVLLWQATRDTCTGRTPATLYAPMLTGFGLFNIVEGVVNHHLLGFHHVNETVPQWQWLYWDLAFLVWGLAMLAGGWLWFRRARGGMTLGHSDPQGAST